MNFKFQTRKSRSTTLRAIHMCWQWTSLETSLRLNTASYTWECELTFPLSQLEMVRPTCHLITWRYLQKLTGDRKDTSHQLKIKVTFYCSFTPQSTSSTQPWYIPNFQDKAIGKVNQNFTRITTSPLIYFFSASVSLEGIDIRYWLRNVKLRPSEI